MKKTRIALLGSTGSIGINTLRVIEAHKDKFEVVVLTAFDNGALLARQVKAFNPKAVALSKNKISDLRNLLGKTKTKIFDVQDSLTHLVARNDVDIVVLAIGGSVALAPFLTAVRLGKTVAPANKEALVVGGHLLMSEAKKHHAKIIPIDSEQSAIFQCLSGQNREALRKIYLTASGGPLLRLKHSKFDQVSVSRILKHPRWKMGQKITVDSATLMNKGLEMIEAKWLFDLTMKEIEVIVHPQAIIHSMVEFHDGSIIAQLGLTDMRLPIQYALSHPKRLEAKLSHVDFVKLKELTFEPPDIKKFPALSLCRQVGCDGGTSPCVLNAANEIAVEAFLKGHLKFTGIYHAVESVLNKHKHNNNATLSSIAQADRWAREEARKVIKA